MKKVVIGIAILSAVIVVAYVSIFAVVNTRGKKILSQRIEAEVGIKPEIGKLSLNFPFTFKINDFSLGELSFAQAQASLAGFNPITSCLRFSRVSLDELDLTIRKKDGEILKSLPATQGENRERTPAPEETAGEKPPEE